jgi:O-antigen/teichoic acid export membrane protein
VALHLSGGLVAGHLVDGASTLTRGSLTTAVDVISINLFLQFLTVPFTATLEGMRRYVVTKPLNSVMNVLRYCLIMVVAVVTGQLEIAFVVITGLTVVRLLVLLTIFVFRLERFRSMRLRFDLQLLKQLCGYSSVLFVTRLIGLIWVQMAKGLIFIYLTATHLAIYDVVLRPSMILRVVAGIIITPIIPEVARLHHENNTRAIGKLFINLVRYAYLLLLPVVAVLAVHMDWLLELWVGADFRQYTNLALIVLAIHVILPLRVIPATMIVGLQRVKQTLWIPVAATVLNIGLSIGLLNLYGLTGLLAAALVAELACALPYVGAMQRYLGFALGEAMRPVRTTALLALGVAAVQLGARGFLGEEPLGLAAVACVTPAAAYFVSYRYILVSEERGFLGERLRSVKAKTMGMAAPPSAEPQQAAVRR